MLRNYQFQKIIDFINIRHKETGGYGATKFLPATVEDTYQALEILFCLLFTNSSLSKKDFFSTKDLSFLLQKWSSKPSHLKTGYQILNLLKKVETLPSLREIKNWLKDKEISNIESLYYFFKIFRLFPFSWEEFFSKEEIVRILKRSKNKTIKFLFQKMYINSLFSEDIDPKDIKWIWACKNPDGGFGFKPGTTSFIENTFYALKALDLSKQDISCSLDTWDFITACQKYDGGFSRRPGAASFLDATWYAIKSIYLLESYL